MERQDRLVSPEPAKDDIVLTRMRPETLDEFIGQPLVTRKLSIAIESARIRNEHLDHVILAGPPGLGKTTLAYIIANELNTKLHITSGPVIEKQGDLAAILTSLEEGDVLFIDEIHRLNKTIEEVLYTAMEDFAVDIMIGKGPSARSIRIDLSPFTLVGATTRMGLLSSPLRNRFGISLELDFYSEEDLKKIVLRSASILNIALDEKAALEIARRSRGTPRVANRLLKRIRDFATVERKNVVDLEIAKKALEILEIDEYGLDPLDRKILKVLIENYNGGPAGIKSIAASVGIEHDSISEVYEPYLLRAGFIVRTPRGRMATEKAYSLFGLKIKGIQGGLWKNDD
ncbi:MAG TPA: Holliday junction branch migration DNA helicase RuvB [Thermotogaceae bacterium]|nr:Holliday junction branch migration DNA helicase RuvB [Thermotogaceae bacterium]